MVYWENFRMLRLGSRLDAITYLSLLSGLKYPESNADRYMWLSLDIAGGHDNVNGNILWNILEGEATGNDCMQFLREIYLENAACVEWEGMGSEEQVDINKGLRQGCPLSPLLFMIYMVGMERALERSNMGFNLSYKQAGTVVEQKLPGLFYANDIVLMANEQSGLQRLANICGHEGENLALKFSAKKSSVIVFNENSQQTVSMQGQEIPRVKEYKYIGVRINEGNRYMETQEKTLTAKGKRNTAIMKHGALKGYNRYEALRATWKGVMVPGLTSRNAVVCLKLGIQSGLDGNQRSVGRLALGAHGKTANEAVQGDMGWTSFEAREAQSRNDYDEPLGNMEESKWAGRVFSYLYRKNIHSQWKK